MPKPLPSPELLRKLLRYDPETGKLYWRPRPLSMFKDSGHSAKHNRAAWNGKYSGREAFIRRDSEGYLNGFVNGHTYSSHRVIWCMVHNEEPPCLIDHKNGNPSDNRIENLRLATLNQNNRNTKPRGGSSKFKGVYLTKCKKKWGSRIKVDNNTKHLGTYHTEEEAALAYDRAALELHGDFASTNRSFGLL